MMKKILPLLVITVALISCNFERDIQVQPAFAQLVKIDTISRQPNNQELLLTWRTDDNIEYISFEPVASNYYIGSKMRVLIRR